jgi:putative ABC transport system substrate-binding protein
MALAALTAPSTLFAQLPSGISPRIGFLGGGSASVAKMPVDALRVGLGALGYVQGRNIAIEYRWGEGNSGRLAALATELVASHMQLIIAWTTPASLAVKRLTSTLPIVMVGVGDPVGTGLVTSLARPGGNITGLADLDVGLSAKRLELLKEVLPKISRLAVLRNPTDPNSALQFKEVRDAAETLHIELQVFDVRNADEFEGAFIAIGKARVEALVVLATAVILSHAKQVADFALRVRLPTVFGRNEHVDEGGLMSYGSTLTDLFGKAATFVDKILRGAKPADLPVEQPTKFDLVINLRAARALGLTIPQSLLIRADRVIE